MILKIEGTKNVWTFIGEVEECESHVIVCESEDGLDELRKKCTKDFTEIRPWDIAIKKVKWIAYLKKGYDWGFTLCENRVFLLSETGKTIEGL